MYCHSTIVRLGLAACFLLATESSIEAQNWPRFRGPNGSGISSAKTIPVSWTMQDFDWVVELPGVGHSSPVTWGDRVFITSADESSGTRHLLCIDAATGARVWQLKFPFDKYKHHKNNSSASSTPVVDEDCVYVLWHSKQETPVVAVDHDGNEVWRHDLGSYLNGQGGAASPIVYQNQVIISNDHKAGSALFALDRKSGEQLWRIPRQGKRACYSTPCVLNSSPGTAELIFTHCFEGIIGVNPVAGSINWMIDVFGKHSQRAVGSPILYDDLVIGTSGARGGERRLVAVRPAVGSSNRVAEKAYLVSRDAPHVPTPLVYNDLLFMWGDLGIVACLRAQTGAPLWKKRVGGNYFGSPVCIDGKLYCVELDGEVVVLAASDKFELLARNPLGKPSRSTPAVGRGRLFIRSYSHLFAISAGGRGQ